MMKKNESRVGKKRVIQFDKGMEERGHERIIGKRESPLISLQ